VKNRFEKVNDEANYWKGRLDAIKDLKAHLIQKHDDLIKEIDDLILVTSMKHIEKLNE
jgi:hypothetical protein